MSKYVGFRVGNVHESHVFSEYYCGGCGYPVTDHDSFCPECGGAFRECDASDLETENAKLREHEARLFDKTLELGTENAKLRELVKELYQCSRQHGCEPCGYRDVCSMFDHMRELGVEVDDGD